MDSTEKTSPVYLDRNEYNYTVSPLVAKTLQEFNPHDLCTYTRCFQQGIKSELSAFLSQMYGIPESNVILGYGGEDILKAAIHCFLCQEAGSRKILIPTFSWWYYKSIADEVNGETLKYPIIEDGYEFRYDIEEIKKEIVEKNPDIILLASPNNPTGNSLTLTEIREIVSQADRHTVVIIDEAYALFKNKDLSYLSSLINEFPNLMIIRSFSKFYGLPGLRLGYAFIGEGLKSFLGFSTMYLGYNKLTEKIGIAALQSTDYYNTNAEQMQKDKELYKEGVNTLPGFKVYNSDANFVLVKYPIELKEKLQKAFAEQHIAVKFMNEEELNSHMRITLGTTEINKQVVHIIQQVANSQ
jgi:Histidinol-phosphate/aromatic aminotransferase and cobyric acid decarboxylase